MSIFPDFFDSFISHGVVGKAIHKGVIEVKPVNIRDFAVGRHKTTDDRPYGGGCGMVLKPEPLAQAISYVKHQSPEAKTILLSPQGRRFDQHVAQSLTHCQSLILVCGRYEGVDARIFERYIDDELSIGDYVLTGGEIAGMAVVDAVSRLVPGVLGGEESADNESFEDGLLEHPHFTRPRCFENIEVPEVLLSGNHREISRWRKKYSLFNTLLKRPELLHDRDFSAEEVDILKEWSREIEAVIRRKALSGTDSSSGYQ